MATPLAMARASQGGDKNRTTNARMGPTAAIPLRHRVSRAARKRARARPRFKETANFSVGCTPQVGIKRKPANTVPAMAPPVLMKYTRPTSWPTRAKSRETIWATHGKVAPTKRVGRNMARALLLKRRDFKKAGDW